MSQFQSGTLRRYQYHYVCTTDCAISEILDCIYVNKLYNYNIDHISKEGLNLRENRERVCLFVLLLYVPSQQLWSLRDGQFT